jgi:hypothetical protein
VSVAFDDETACPQGSFPIVDDRPSLQRGFVTGTDLKERPLGYLRFADCGFTDRTIRALLAGGIATPEQLFSMTPDQIRLIPGVGAVLMKEVERNRAQFNKRNPP